MPGEGPEQTSVHVVRQGEDLHQILRRLGSSLTVDDVMNHPDNRALFASRKAGILRPGDEIVVESSTPRAVKVAAGKEHRFRYRPPRRRLEVRLLAEDGGAMCGAAYALEIGGERFEGRTDDAGRVIAEIALDAERGVLHVGGRELGLEIGHLDPLCTTAGVQARLRNLGLFTGDVDGRFGAHLSGALRAFQRKHGLAVTGQADPETRRKLRDEHGC